jgi:hypothetical protein
MERSNIDKISQEIDIINNIIKQATINGINMGSNYELNNEVLINAINEYLEVKNLSSDYTVDKTKIIHKSDTYSVFQITKKITYNINVVGSNSYYDIFV